MDEIVYKLRKSATEEIRLRLRRYEGRDFVDIRVWFEKESGHAEFLPSKKGIMISVYVFPELMKGMKALEEELVQRGLLEPQA